MRPRADVHVSRDLAKPQLVQECALAAHAGRAPRLGAERGLFEPMVGNAGERAPRFVGRKRALHLADLSVPAAEIRLAHALRRNAVMDDGARPVEHAAAGRRRVADERDLLADAKRVADGPERRIERAVAESGPSHGEVGAVDLRLAEDARFAAVAEHRQAVIQLRREPGRQRARPPRQDPATRDGDIARAQRRDELADPEPVDRHLVIGERDDLAARVASREWLSTITASSARSPAASAASVSDRLSARLSRRDGVIDCDRWVGNGVLSFWLRRGRVSCRGRTLRAVCCGRACFDRMAQLEPPLRSHRCCHGLAFVKLGAIRLRLATATPGAESDREAAPAATLPPCRHT